MSAFADERLALSIEQHALLWAIRLWTAEHPSGSDIILRLEPVLGRLGTESLAAPLDRFMATLHHGATRKIGIHYLCQARIGEDEHALLDSLSLAQHGRPFEALLLLRCLVTPRAARTALRHAEDCGKALSTAGRMLPPPAIDMRHLAFTSGSDGDAGVSPPPRHAHERRQMNRPRL